MSAIAWGEHCGRAIPDSLGQRCVSSAKGRSFRGRGQTNIGGCCLPFRCVPFVDQPMQTKANKTETKL